VNPEDGFSRSWGLGIDTIPTGNWLKDPAIIKQNGMKSGETWKFNFTLVDGKHTIYFIISQTPGLLGSYQGTAMFGDKAEFSFLGVNNDSVAAFEINVTGGTFVRSRSQPNTETETPSATVGLIPRIRGSFSFLRGIPLQLKGIGSGKANAYNATLVVVASSVIIGSVFAVKKRMRRRF
jgi:hypothetical protein